MKISKDKQELVFWALRAQIEGNISNGSKKYFGADGVSKILAKEVPEGKLVRFVDSANTEIPHSAMRV